VELYFIRHADAVPLGEQDITADEDRPLTEAGQAQARQVGAALRRRGVALDLILTSPLVRARQTAEGLLADWPAPAPELRDCDLLAPDKKRRKLARALNDLDKERVALVGHEPDLSAALAWLIGSKKARLEMAKAAVACVAFDAPLEIDKGAGTLLWLVPPRWLG
jgi:phosphohistidine phosphatase